MDFYSLNKFNAFVNSMSGNFLPLTKDSTRMSNTLMLYSAFTCLVEFLYFVIVFRGIFVTTSQRILQDTTINVAVVIETFILGTHMNLQRDLICRLIGKLNSVLIDAETLQESIDKTVKPLQMPLKLYTIFATVNVILYCMSPIYQVFEKDQFGYNDFRAPAYIKEEPYSTGLFVAGVALETLGAVFTVLKKTSVDLYIIHVITLLTAQYRYLSVELIDILDGKNRSKKKKDLESWDNERNEEIEKTVQNELRNWIKRREVVMETGKLLKNLLRLNVIYLYVNCIVRFCFLAYLLLSTPGEHFLHAIDALYSSVCLMHIYVLCSCSQDLLDSSTTMGEDAFYEKWYAYGPSTKRIFSMILISNKMECRLSMCGIVDLTLPTFMAILKNSYSGCLFILKIK